MKYKVIFRFLSLVAISIIISVLVLKFYQNYLNIQIEKYYNPAVGRTYGVDEMNKGIKILQYRAEKGDLIILGSSELDTQEIPQNPRNFFPNSQLNCNVDLVGRALVQDLQNSIKIGALGENFKNKKIVLIVSMQWFIGEQVDVSGFNAHFSPVQFYKFLSNKNVSEDSKKYVCLRTSELLKNESLYNPCILRAKLYNKNNFTCHLLDVLFKPFYFIQEKFLLLKDKYQSLKAISKFKNEAERETLNINWEEEESRAQEMGKSSCTNNDIFVQDNYYTTYLEPRWNELKNSSVDVDLISSREFEDYEYFLKICREVGVRPYIIFAPANGWYYDYIGITRENRINYYNKLLELANKYDFNCLDLRDKEYEPYILKDVMHLGWKGWLYVDQKITEYFS